MKYPRMLPLDQELIGYHDSQQWPEPLRQRIAADPAARERWECSCRVARLLTLKTYERPDTQAAARCRVAIRAAIDDVAASSGRAAWAWPLSVHLLNPAVRYGAAAALLVLLGVHVTTNSRLPAIHTSPQTLQRTVVATPPQEERIAASEERANPQMTPEIWSNLAPRVHQHDTFRLIGTDH